MEHRFNGFKMVAFLGGNIVELGQIAANQLMMSPVNGDTLRLNVAVDAPTWEKKWIQKYAWQHMSME
jgi:hypothetical protein